jgi:hypothetical protein
MNTAASPGFGYQPSAPQNPAYQNPAWGTPNFYGMPYWHPYGMSRPVCIALMVLGFAFWWPIGLAMLAFGIASGRLGCRGRRAWKLQCRDNGQAPWDQWRQWYGNGNGGGDRTPPTGNRAFDDYRAETLRRLEEEQKEFGGFLDRLRFARDKQEFDQFMAERRNQPPAPPAPEPPHQG